MGDQRRMTPTGPRALEDLDLREDGQPKVIRNPNDTLTIAPARFVPLVAPLSWFLSWTCEAARSVESSVAVSQVRIR